MKKLVLAVMVVFSLNAVVAQKGGKPAPTAQPKELKIAHINSQKLIDSLPSYMYAKGELERMKEEGYKELEEMYNDLMMSMKALDSKRATLIPIQIQYEEEKLNKKDQAMKEAEQTLNNQLQAVAQSLNTPILERVKKAVEIVSLRHKISYVLDEDQLVYWGGGLDIQAEVKAELFRLDAEAMKKP